MFKVRTLLLLVAAFALPLSAQQTEPLAISLDDAIQNAVQRNLGVQFQRYEYEQAGYSAKSAYGFFDWQAFADVESSSSQTPAASLIESSQTDRTIANFGIRQNIPTGGNYAIGFNNNRRASDNQFVTVNPSYNSSFGFSFMQPLMRDFGTDISRRGIKLARNNLGVSRESFRTILTNTTLGVVQAYYDLIFARQNLEVKRLSLALAKDQERITQIKIDVGANAPLDILQPRVAIATRDEEIIIAEAQVRDAEDRLRRLMNLPMQEWNRPIEPTDDISYRETPIDVTAAVERALEQRPELAQARIGVESRRIEYRYARNQVLPQLDLALSYGVGGIGGNRIIRDPETGEQIGVVEGGISDAFDQVTAFDFPSWTVGFSVGVPVTNIGARAEAKRAELDLRQETARVDDVRQTIILEVRQTVRDIDTAARRITAARAARDAAEKNVDAERKRYENGMTTNFNVLSVQQELSDARSREIAALVLYNKAIASFHRAVGDLLEVHDIKVDDLQDFSLPPSRLEDVRWLRSDRGSK